MLVLAVSAASTQDGEVLYLADRLVAYYEPRTFDAVTVQSGFWRSFAKDAFREGANVMFRLQQSSEREKTRVGRPTLRSRSPAVDDKTTAGYMKGREFLLHAQEHSYRGPWHSLMELLCLHSTSLRAFLHLDSRTNFKGPPQ